MSQYISLREAAEYLGYSQSGLRKLVDRSRRLADSGLEPELKFAQGRAGGKILFKVAWLDEFASAIEAREVTPQPKRTKKELPDNDSLKWNPL